MVIERTRDPQHGDFACNIAMRLAKTLQQPPREIAAAIIDAQRSTIEVDSEPGKGSCFRFRIPLVEDEDGPDAPTLGTGAKDAKTENSK